MCMVFGKGAWARRGVKETGGWGGVGQRGGREEEGARERGSGAVGKKQGEGSGGLRKEAECWQRDCLWDPAVLVEPLLEAHLPYRACQLGDEAPATVRCRK